MSAILCSWRSVILTPSGPLLKCSKRGNSHFFISAILTLTASWTKSALLLYCGCSLTNFSTCSTNSRLRLTPLKSWPSFGIEFPSFPDGFTMALLP